MKSRQIKAPVTEESGLPEGKGYCRRCGEIKPSLSFYNAWDKELDKANGLMSVCKDCCNSLFDTILASEGSIQKTVLRMCRQLNLKYDEHTIDLTISHLEGLREKGKTVPPFFSIYKFKLTSGLKMPMKDRASVDLTYQEVTSITVSGQNTLDNFNKEEIDQDVIMFWGEGYETEDYRWLEKTFEDWCSSHKSDTMGEKTLLKEIVHKQFEIEKARLENKGTGGLVKELQDLMKTAAVDPSKSNIAGAGKAHDNFSAFIKTIEETEPADYYADKALFKDFDNIGFYMEKYITRPLKNFITSSRDFNVTDDSDDNDVEDDAVDVSSALSMIDEDAGLPEIKDTL